MNSKKEIYIAMLDKYGAKSQIAKAAEECAELSAALSKMVVWELAPVAERTGESFAELRNAIIGEMGDVYNLLEQIERILEIDEVDLYKKQIEILHKLKKKVTE